MNGEGLLDQGQLARLDDRFQLRVHAQLATEAADVRAHGRVADPQLVGDLAARRAFRHKPQDFLLARGQTLELGLDLAPGIQQLGDGPRREQRPAIRDLWMNALAPASRAANRAASLSSRVRKMSFASGRSWRIPVAASAPVPSVSRKSIRTRSGLSSAARAIESATEPACPTTVMS